LEQLAIDMLVIHLVGCWTVHWVSLWLQEVSWVTGNGDLGDGFSETIAVAEPSLDFLSGSILGEL
jgi:hypothetical protein